MGTHHLTIAASSSGTQGGWAWRRVGPDGQRTQGMGAEAGASAYRLRLRAAVEALRSVPSGAVVTGWTGDGTFPTLVHRWLPGWRKRGFRKKGGKPVGDRDLVEALAEQLDRVKVVFDQADKGDPGLEDVRRLAKLASARSSGPAAAATPASTGSAWDRFPPLKPGAALVAWTDGGCRGNPGPGGWGMILVHRKTGATLQARGGEDHTTNNRMELEAIAQALRAITKPGAPIEIRTDSRFCIDALTKWMKGWKKRGWKKKGGEPPVHVDLFQELDTLLHTHRVRFTHVRGHAGEPGNERADALTNEAMDRVQAGQDPAWSDRAKAPPFALPD